MSMITTVRNIFGLYREGELVEPVLTKKEQAKKNTEAFRRNIERAKKNIYANQMKESKKCNEKYNMTTADVLKEINEIVDATKEKDIKKITREDIVGKERVKELKKEKEIAKENPKEKAMNELDKYNKEFKAIKNPKVLKNIIDEIEKAMKTYKAIRKEEITETALLNIYRDVYNAYKLDEIGETLDEKYVARMDRRRARLLKEEVNKRLAALEDNKGWTNEEDIHTITEEIKRDITKAFNNKEEKVDESTKEEINEEKAKENINNETDGYDPVASFKNRGFDDIAYNMMQSRENLETIDEYGNIVNLEYYDDEYLNNDIFYEASSLAPTQYDDYNNGYYDDEDDNYRIEEARRTLENEVNYQCKNYDNMSWSELVYNTVKNAKPAIADDGYEIENFFK